MPNDQYISLMQLAQMMPPQGQQQSPMTNPNFAIPPQGRYINGSQWMPNNLDPMARPSNGLPPDVNTYDPQSIMDYRGGPSLQQLSNLGKPRQFALNTARDGSPNLTDQKRDIEFMREMLASPGYSERHPNGHSQPLDQYNQYRESDQIPGKLNIRL